MSGLRCAYLEKEQGYQMHFSSDLETFEGKYEVRDKIVRMRRMGELESDSRVECDLPTCNSRHDNVRKA